MICPILVVQRLTLQLILLQPQLKEGIKSNVLNIIIIYLPPFPNLCQTVRWLHNLQLLILIKTSVNPYCGWNLVIVFDTQYFH